MAQRRSAAKPISVGRAFGAGAAAVSPTLLFVAPFGVLAGALSAEAGFNVAQAAFLSGFVFAGASQLSTIGLLSAGAPALIIVAAGLAINLRFTMYSATLAKWLRGGARRWRIGAAALLVDNGFAVAIDWFHKRPAVSPTARAAFLCGAGFTSWIVWMIGTLLGFAVGAALPASWNLDFAAPIAFLAMALPLLRGRPAWAAALAASATAIALRDLPYDSGVLVAGVLGVLAALLAERFGDRPDETQGEDRNDDPDEERPDRLGERRA